MFSRRPSAVMVAPRSSSHWGTLLSALPPSCHPSVGSRLWMAQQRKHRAFSSYLLLLRCILRWAVKALPLPAVSRASSHLCSWEPKWRNLNKYLQKVCDAVLHLFTHIYDTWIATASVLKQMIVNAALKILFLSFLSFDSVQECQIFSTSMEGYLLF